MDDSWITTAQAAAILEVTPRRVLALIKLGRITGNQPGREWFVKREEVEKLAEQERPAGRPKTKPSE